MVPGGCPQSQTPRSLGGARLGHHWVECLPTETPPRRETAWSALWHGSPARGRRLQRVPERTSSLPRTESSWTRPVHGHGWSSELFGRELAPLWQRRNASRLSEGRLQRASSARWAMLGGVSCTAHWFPFFARGATESVHRLPFSPILPFFSAVPRRRSSHRGRLLRQRPTRQDACIRS